MNDVFELFGDVAEAHVSPPPPSTAPKAARGAPRPEPVAEVPTPEPDAPAPRCAQILDCGHMDWAGDAANEVARSEGRCCANHRHQVFWSHLRGAYVRPIPVHYRRTLEKERGPGFPGYCCDDDGFYIGGVANDCRHHASDDRRCVVHGAPRPRVVDEDDPPVDLEPVVAADDVTTSESPSAPSTLPPLPKATGSWKQRQMSAKRGKR